MSADDQGELFADDMIELVEPAHDPAMEVADESVEDEDFALWSPGGEFEKEAKLVEYAPGKHCVFFGERPIPRYGVVRWVPAGDGLWRPMIRGWGKYVALRRFFRPGATGKEVHPMMRRLGLDLSYNSVLRLYKNGFITGLQPVPHKILIDLESLQRHLTEAQDPDFWTPERVRQFKETVY